MDNLVLNFKLLSRLQTRWDGNLLTYLQSHYHQLGYRNNIWLCPGRLHSCNVRCITSTSNNNNCNNNPNTTYRKHSIIRSTDCQYRACNDTWRNNHTNHTRTCSHRHCLRHWGLLSIYWLRCPVLLRSPILLGSPVLLGCSISLRSSVWLRSSGVCRGGNHATYIVRVYYHRKVCTQGKYWTTLIECMIDSCTLLSPFTFIETVRDTGVTEEYTPQPSEATNTPLYSASQTCTLFIGRLLKLQRSTITIKCIKFGIKYWEDNLQILQTYSDGVGKSQPNIGINKIIQFRDIWATQDNVLRN